MVDDLKEMQASTFNHGGNTYHVLPPNNKPQTFTFKWHTHTCGL